jgi:UDP-N-acetylmuramate--alanine ligase
MYWPAGGLDPTVVIGGKLKSIGRNAVLGQGDFIVAEADESDGSFLKFSPAIAVVTNIDREHLDYYKDLDAIKTVFLDFIDRIPFYGLAVLCLDDEPLQGLLPRIKKRVTTYGRSTQADYQARDIRFKDMQSKFTVVHRGENLGRFCNWPCRACTMCTMRWPRSPSAWSWIFELDAIKHA